MFVESTEELTAAKTKERRLPAPWQHTLLLSVVLVLWAIYGALRADLSLSELPLPVRYISTIVVQWLLVGSTIAGLYNRRSFVLDALGLSSGIKPWRDLAMSMVILVSGWLTVILVHIVLRRTPLRVVAPSEALKSLVPGTSLQMIIWVFVAMTAGCCEEFIFRGYLQRQASELCNSRLAGIVLPSLLFGCLHLYQGVGSAIGIAGLGLVYAVFVARFGNLRSVMIAHATQDFLAGLIHYIRHH